MEMERTAVSCKISDFVWAKVIGYSYWPGLILQPDRLAPPKNKSDMEWVYFFGSQNYAWVPIKYIKPYSEFKEKFGKKCPQGVLDAKYELRKHKKRLTANPDYVLTIAKFMPKEMRARSKSVSKSSRSVVDEQEHYLIPEPRIGVLAGNINAESIIKALISFKHKMIIWSESEALCIDMKQEAAEAHTTCYVYKEPRDVVRTADIIFSLLASKAEAIRMLEKFGYKNDNDYLLSGKIYIEMTTIDRETSSANAKIFSAKGVTYFEFMIDGTKQDIGKGLVLVGGNCDQFKATIERLKSCLKALGKSWYFVENPQVFVIFQMMKAIFLAGFTEILALADKSVDLNVFFELFRNSPLHNHYFERVCDKVENNTYFDVQESLPCLQHGLQRMLELCNVWKQPAGLTSTANQLYKHARRMGLDEADSSAMFLRAK
ncbi:hypothetical protein HUJ04_012946 [Dendroctonus ponderosae]|uniref:Cytokine-like nuclear factor N-PAC n=2 Tax=Dendroctonus ponderosae TaxID=77166 RepID=A0AAR5Q6R8_DENPD|nr:hypothetical protein HUJ04_012946 [Dendroctonus ponderosae]